MKKKSVLIICLVLIGLLGISYAYFNYYKETENQILVSGDIYLRLNDGNDDINISGIFPETIEEARDTTLHTGEENNILTFSVSGKNETDKDMYYQIELTNGEEEEEKTRFNPEHLVFDLIEVVNNEEVYLLDAVSFNSLNNTKIWVDKVESGETINKTYKLRMWLSDSVTFGYGDVTYNQEDYVNRYASIKVAVRADLEKKSISATTGSNSFGVENGVSYSITKLSNNYLLEEEGQNLEENDLVRLEVTNSENKLYFRYRDSKGNEDMTDSTNLQLDYTFSKNEMIDIQIFTLSRNDTNVNTDLNFKVYKNGVVVQEYIKHINIVGNNFCLNNGFTNLADCLLVSEGNSKTVNAAKTLIASKGSPNVNQTAPAYAYVEKDLEDGTRTGTAGYSNWYFSDDYEFNSSDGKFYLKNSNGLAVNEANNAFELSNTYIGYYTCGATSSGTNCDTLFKVKTVDTANNSITGSRKTYQIASSLDSQVGLYAVSDDLGTSYIYRGNVTNNNVSFGGYFWKILRINGDGSIRLIFNGGGASLPADGGKTLGGNAAINATNANGYGGATYPFNSNPGGPTYVGYMNTESENYWTTTTLASYYNFAEDTVYYFADDFETITDTYGNRQFKLKGNTYTSKLKDLTNDQIAAKPYTCSGTNANLICSRLVKVDSRTNNTTVQGYYVTYSPNYEAIASPTKADVEKNLQDSNAKKQLEKWYHDKFMTKTNNEKAVTDYIVDNIWCNDRSILPNYKNSAGNFVNNPYNTGYLLTSHTYYAGMTRLYSTSIPYRYATLMCSNTNDKFSATNALGNGALTYPVGLITADEVALAGAVYNEKNENFYLRTNGYYWTMTPFYFRSTYAGAYEFSVYPAGQLLNYFDVYIDYGLRAVINIDKNAVLALGDGSAANPYILE